MSGPACECPVCFCAFTCESPASRQFECDHWVCAACDEKLFVRAHDACPLCRAPRTRASLESRDHASRVMRYGYTERDHWSGAHGRRETVVLLASARLGSVIDVTFVTVEDARARTHPPSVSGTASLVSDAASAAGDDALLDGDVDLDEPSRAAVRALRHVPRTSLLGWRELLGREVGARRATRSVARRVAR